MHTVVHSIVAAIANLLKGAVKYSVSSSDFEVREIVSRTTVEKARFHWAVQKPSSSQKNGMPLVDGTHI